MATGSIVNDRLPQTLTVRGAVASLTALVTVERVLIFWFAASPIASYYIRFPVDKSIVTFDRLVIAIAVVALLATAWAKATAGSGRAIVRVVQGCIATKFEVAWALVAAIALLNAAFLANDFPYALRLAVDTFALPLVMFHLARYHFDARGRGAYILLAAIGLAWLLFASGAYEFESGANLFQYKGSELVREGERRVNGPFAADSSYSIISLMVFVILLAAPNLFRLKKDRWARLLYAGGLIAAAAATLLPMFRSAAIALVGCLLIVKLGSKRKDTDATDRDVIEKRRPRRRFLSPEFRIRLTGFSPNRRLAAIVLAAILLAGAGALALGRLSATRRLADPRNVIGRLVTWRTAAAITLDNPVFGVGLANYQWAFDQRYFWDDEPVDELLDTPAANSPHSNLLWVASEMGVVAFLLYLVANIYLFMIGWRAFRRAQSTGARAAAAAFLALFLAYWVPGLTLASGYYSDLNLYFFFLTGLLSNGSLTADSSTEVCQTAA